MKRFVLAAIAALALSTAAAPAAAQYSYPSQYSDQEFDGGRYTVTVCVEDQYGNRYNEQRQSNRPYSHPCVYDRYRHFGFDPFMAFFWGQHGGHHDRDWNHRGNWGGGHDRHDFGGDHHGHHH